MSGELRGADLPSLPLHKLEYGVQLAWRPSDHRTGPIGEYIEVASPLDQSRIGGDPPRPFAKEPRYAWSLGQHQSIHIAGWVGRREANSEVVSDWYTVDLYIPVGNVIQWQVFQHDDWESKPEPEEPQPEESK